MTTQTLRQAWLFLPTFRSAEAPQVVDRSASASESHLPRWERHPVGRSGRETGSMDREWTLVHLP